MTSVEEDTPLLIYTISKKKQQQQPLGRKPDNKRWKLKTEITLKWRGNHLMA